MGKRKRILVIVLAVVIALSSFMVVYLTDLLLKASLQLQPSGSISSDFLGRVLASDKVVAINYRLSTLQFGGQQRFSEGYFVLEDNLNEGLSGKIITVEVGKQGYGLWAISK
jgi:hypothetical protein